MGRMLHRKKMQRAAKQAALLQNANTPENYRTEVPEEQQYTRTDINRMSKDDLVALANEVGIARANEKNGSELKRELIEKFNL